MCKTQSLAGESNGAINAKRHLPSQRTNHAVESEADISMCVRTSCICCCSCASASWQRSICANLQALHHVCVWISWCCRLFFFFLACQTYNLFCLFAHCLPCSSGQVTTQQLPGSHLKQQTAALLQPHLLVTSVFFSPFFSCGGAGADRKRLLAQAKLRSVMIVKQFWHVFRETFIFLNVHVSTYCAILQFW